MKAFITINSTTGIVDIFSKKEELNLEIKRILKKFLKEEICEISNKINLGIAVLVMAKENELLEIKMKTSIGPEEDYLLSYVIKGEETDIYQAFRKAEELIVEKINDEDDSELFNGFNNFITVGNPYFVSTRENLEEEDEDEDEDEDEGLINFKITEKEKEALLKLRDNPYLLNGILED